MSNMQEIRWQRSQLLLAENALTIELMAACLGLGEQEAHLLLGEKPSKKITDALARQMEQTFSKPDGWLSQNDDGGISYDLFGE